MNGYREWFEDQARDLVMWGLGKAEEVSSTPLWNTVVNSASHDIKEYMTEQLETEFLQRHPEAIEYPEVVNMSHEIMYPTEKKTLQEFWTGWENNLERAKEDRSWFHDEMAKKPYEAPPWKEPTYVLRDHVPLKEVDTIDFNITRPEVPDKHIESDTQKRVDLDQDSIHIVKKGDVLSKIAQKYGVSVNDIMKENDIKHRNKIYPDQKIIIPTPKTWSDQFLASKEPFMNLKGVAPHIKKPTTIIESDQEIRIPGSSSKILLKDEDVKKLSGKKAVQKVEKLLNRKLKPVEKKIVLYEGFVDGIYNDPAQNKLINAWGVGQTGKYMTKDGDKYTIDGFVNKVDEAIGWAEKTFPNWKTLSEELKNEIIASYYRGGINQWPETRKHIIAGNWQNALSEILDNDEYKKTKLGGVIKRFHNFFSALANENTKK